MREKMYCDKKELWKN